MYISMIHCHIAAEFIAKSLRDNVKLKYVFRLLFFTVVKVITIIMLKAVFNMLLIISRYVLVCDSN